MTNKTWFAYKPDLRNPKFNELNKNPAIQINNKEPNRKKTKTLMNNLWRLEEIMNPNPQNQGSPTKQNIKKTALEVFEGHPFTNASCRGQSSNTHITKP